MTILSPNIKNKTHLCRTVPPVDDLDATALPGLRAPTDVELEGAGYTNHTQNIAHLELNRVGFSPDNIARHAY